MMKILITNDDGISSPSIIALAKWAKKHGEVTVVAPLVEQSGKSQSIDFHKSVEIKKVDLIDGCEVYTMNSTPADCVRFGITGLGREYDLVLSGINRGYNLGDDIAYSGTVGAILEAGRLQTKAIALSTDVDSFEAAYTELDNAYSFIKDNGLLFHASLLNVNFPTVKSKGIVITRQGGMFYSDEFVRLEDGTYIQVGEPIQSTDTDLSVDISAIQNGYISITPVTATKTDLLAYDKIKSIKQ